MIVDVWFLHPLLNNPHANQMLSVCFSPACRQFVYQLTFPRCCGIHPCTFATTSADGENSRFPGVLLIHSIITSKHYSDNNNVFILGQSCLLEKNTIGLPKHKFYSVIVVELFYLEVCVIWMGFKIKLCMPYPLFTRRVLLPFWKNDIHID